MLVLGKGARMGGLEREDRGGIPLSHIVSSLSAGAAAAPAWSGEVPTSCSSDSRQSCRERRARYMGTKEGRKGGRGWKCHRHL